MKVKQLFQIYLKKQERKISKNFYLRFIIILLNKYNNQSQGLVKRVSKKNLFINRSFIFRHSSFCEERINWMFRLTLIPLINNSNILIRLGLFTLVNILYATSLFCYIFYQEYYINQPEIWTFDLILSFIIYNILYYYYDKSNQIYFCLM